MKHTNEKMTLAEAGKIVRAWAKKETGELRTALTIVADHASSGTHVHSFYDTALAELWRKYGNTAVPLFTQNSVIAGVLLDEIKHVVRHEVERGLKGCKGGVR